MVRRIETRSLLVKPSCKRSRHRTRESPKISHRYSKQLADRGRRVQSKGNQKNEEATIGSTIALILALKSLNGSVKNHNKNAMSVSLIYRRR